MVTPVGLSIASLFMSLERIEGLSKALELGRKPVVLFDSAMATGRQARKRQTEKEKEKEEERANKTARVKWGRGKREANGK